MLVAGVRVHHRDVFVKRQDSLVQTFGREVFDFMPTTVGVVCRAPVAAGPVLIKRSPLKQH